MTDHTRALLEQALDALEAAKNGLLWYQDTYPDATNDSDDEAMGKIDSALETLRAELAKPEQEETFIPNWANYRQGVADGKAGCPKWYDAPEVAALKAERDAAMKDAERYRFIRDADRSDCITCELSLYALESLDEYVDAAMEDEARSAIAKAEGDAIKKGG